jgi:hypothetical protein
VATVTRNLPYERGAEVSGVATATQQQRENCADKTGNTQKTNGPLLNAKNQAFGMIAFNARAIF